MQGSYPRATISENREQGIWPVPSHSSNGYCSIIDDVQSEVQSKTGSPSNQLRILDIGASFGDCLAEFAQNLQSRLGQDVETVALDVNPHAVRGVRQRENANVVIQGMTQQVPLDNNSIDIIIVKRLLQFLYPQDQSYGLREIERVISKTGVAVIEFDPAGTRSLNTSQLWVLSARSIRHLRHTTDDFTSYSFSIPSEGKRRKS